MHPKSVATASVKKSFSRRAEIIILMGAVIIMLGIVPAQATLTLQSGLVGGSGDVDNVVYNPCGTSAGPSTTVQGCLNTDDSILVNFSSNENLLISGGGQAVINAQDGSFNRVTIALNDPILGFSKLQFNLDVSADSTASFVAVDQFGTVFNFGPLGLNGEGENFFTLGSIDGQVAVSFTVTTTAEIQSLTGLEQVRLGPTEIDETLPQIPEPTSLLLLGAGLVALRIFRRRNCA